MMRQVGVQIRLWPWSTAKDEIVVASDNLSFPYYGSPVLEVANNVQFVLPKRNEQFIPHGGIFSSLQGNYRLYEMPHGVLSVRDTTSTLSDLQNIMIFSDNQMQEIRIDAEFSAKQREEEELSKLAQIVMAWSQFFDDCINIRQKEHSENQLPWQEICKYLTMLSGEMSEPHMALIVHIAEKMRKRLEPTVRMARKVLLRERSLLPAERITETDTACLRWYIRQPGKTMAQKAAQHRQSLLGIARKESFDTLENRVLKDFLIRCKLASQKYIAVEVGKQFQQSRRGKTVRQFQNLCTELIANSNLLDVAQLRIRVKPNYVLQNDARYREVWQNYQRLLRHEEEEDRSWDWQSRTWVDIARLLIGATLASMDGKSAKRVSPFARPLLQASMHIHREQRLGSRVVAGSEPGPFAITPDKTAKNAEWMLEIVHSEEAYAHEITKELACTGAHIYLVLERIGRQERRVILIWAVHTASSTQKTDWNNISLSAQRALDFYESSLGRYQTNFPKLSGMVIASNLNATKVDWHSAGGVPVFDIPANPKRWAPELESMAYLLQEHLEEAVR